jgi:hypothetical protein
VSLPSMLLAVGVSPAAPNVQLADHCLARFNQSRPNSLPLRINIGHGRTENRYRHTLAGQNIRGAVTVPKRKPSTIGPKL